MDVESFKAAFDLGGKALSLLKQTFRGGSLLYPISNKGYRQELAISKNWDFLEHALGNCFMFTIFGYSAPKSDEGAMALLNKAWGVRGAEYGAD